MKSPARAFLAASALASMAPIADCNAAGFAIYVQGVSGLGSAYAGAAATAEDATTVWWNPAGMARLPSGKHLAAAGAFIVPSIKLSDAGSLAPAGRPLGDTGGDAGHSALVPNLYFAMDLAPRVHAGFGVSTPFGLKTQYEPTWLGRFRGSLRSSRRSISIRRSPTA